MTPQDVIRPLTMNSETNPLLTGDFRIPFHQIEAAHVEPGIRQALEEAQGEIDATAADPSPPTWDNTIARLDRAVERLTECIEPAGHLIAVAETLELREAYNAVLPDMSTFWSSIALNEALWLRVKAYAGSSEAKALTGIYRRHCDKTVRDFERAGADLPAETKKRLQTLQVDLAQLEQKFSENVLDATAAFDNSFVEAAR